MPPQQFIGALSLTRDSGPPTVNLERAWTLNGAASKPSVLLALNRPTDADRRHIIVLLSGNWYTIRRCKMMQSYVLNFADVILIRLYWTKCVLQRAILSVASKEETYVSAEILSVKLLRLLRVATHLWNVVSTCYAWRAEIHDPWEKIYVDWFSSLNVLTTLFLHWIFTMFQTWAIIVAFQKLPGYANIQRVEPSSKLRVLCSFKFRIFNAAEFT